MYPKAVLQVTVIQVPAHTGHSLGLLSANTQLADESPWTMNMLSLLQPLKCPWHLFHYRALGHSQAESKGQLTLQAQRCHLTVTMCLTHRAGTMLTSWTLTHLTHTSHSPVYRDVSCFYTPLLKNPYFLPLFLH